MTMRIEEKSVAIRLTEKFQTVGRGSFINRLRLRGGERSEERLIGDGIPGGKLDKKWQLNFSPAYLFNKFKINLVHLFHFMF